jgi:hypothetical protein
MLVIMTACGQISVAAEQHCPFFLIFPAHLKRWSDLAKRLRLLLDLYFRLDSHSRYF